MTIRVDARKVPMKGETVYLRIQPEEAHVFSSETGRRVSGDAAPVAGGATRVSQA
jgi:multiple sugar transport system ATP-binding protein